MANNTEELKSILQGCIGSVYAKALERTGETELAKDITRRVMALLKRTHEAGLSINRGLIDRLTEDCCRESEYYDSQRSAFRNGTIADMPDFDTALSAITQEEVQAKARSDAEAKAIEAHAAMRGAEALGARVVSEECLPDPMPLPTREARREAPVLFPDYDGEDLGETEPEREDRKRKSILPTLALSLLTLILAVLVVCLFVMLITRGVLPGADNQTIVGFTRWFNSRLFPLF